MRYITLKKILLIFSALATVIYLPQIVKAVATDCSVYRTSVAPDGYAPPISFFSPSGLIVKTMCDGRTSFQLTAGSDSTNELVYQTGHWYDGREWKPVTLSGDHYKGDENSPWLVGTGKASIVNPLSGRNYVVAYVCTSVGGVWKCGCTTAACTANKWQLQAFDNGSVAGTNCSGGSAKVNPRQNTNNPYETWPDACVGKPYTLNITCDSTADYGFSFNISRPEDAPPGLSIDNKGRVTKLEGTPTAAGTYEFRVTGKNGTANCSGGVRITVKGQGGGGGARNCSGGSVLTNHRPSTKNPFETWPNACVGQPYKVKFTACTEGQSEGISFTGFKFISGTNSPPGLDVGEENRRNIVSGTPTIAGTYEFYMTSRSGTFTCRAAKRITVLP